jgi:hypothetical protein
MDGTRGNRSDLTIDGVPSTATADAGQVIASYVPPADIVQEFQVQSPRSTPAPATPRRRDQPDDQVRHQHARGTVSSPRHPRPFANDFFANANNIPLSDFTTPWRHGRRPDGAARLRRPRQDFLPAIRGHPRIEAAQQRHADGADREMRTGDFSELLALGSQYQIYNPFTRRAVANGRFQQDPFPGNIIPQHLINPVARAALEYFAHPLTAGNADGTSNFQNPSLPEDIKYANNTVRIDHNLTDKQRMYGRFSWYDRNSNYNNYFGNLATGEWFKFVSRQAAVDHVYVMTPSTVLNFRYGYNWFVRGTDSNRPIMAST